MVKKSAAPGSVPGSGRRPATAGVDVLAEVMPAAEFKARCLELMDKVQQQHTEIIITKRGKPVAKLVPVDNAAPESFGFLRGTVRYHGDIVTPDHESWDDREAGRL